MATRAAAKTRAEEIMHEINAQMKKPVLTMASSQQFVVSYGPTGIDPFDILFKGGLPRGRFVTLIGDWSTLKSYVGLMAIASAQARGEVCALIDTEHAFDPQWAMECGVDLSQLIMPPKIGPEAIETGEEAIDYAEALIRSGVDLIVFDSVAATLPQAERDRRLAGESQQMARLATLMSRAMRKLTAPNSRTCVLWINQIRMNVGVTFGNPETPTGGKALPYYSSLICEIKKIGKVTRDIKVHDGDKDSSGKEIVAQKFKATLVKSKLSKPLRDVLFDWSLELGRVDNEKFLFAQGVENGLLNKTGNRWQVKGSRTAPVNGREKFVEHLRNDVKDRELLRSKVLAVHGLTFPGSPAPASKKVVQVRRPKPSDVVRKSIPTPVRETSRATRVTPKRSSSSKTPRVLTR